MTSILPGFEYDIFISYRHNDNRSGWVTEFVKKLQEELAATIKESISVYYDTNPHDGLLETHHVDKSLEGKLKCLIFIPILSQTYCDPKSFAWQHEFCSFNKLAQVDEFGRDIKLSNGNVTSRILPIKIHDLDAEDKSIIENEIGGILRAIEFIYKEPGVNRPLKPTDSKSDNQNQTDYTNQVNKVANAIKEIVHALNPKNKSFAYQLEQRIVYPTKKTRKLGASLAIGILVVAVAFYFLYPKLIGAPTAEEPEKSIAVLPFVNMSGDTEQEYFSDGISEELINALAKLPDMKVTGRTSSFAYKGRNENLQVIGKELGVSHILEGSVRKSGNTLRITAQLIHAGNGFHLWTETYDRELEDIFKIQDEITEAITKQLKIRLEGDQQLMTKATETNLGAYEIYMKARQELALRGDHLYEARKLFDRVIELDPDYSLAYSGLGVTLSLVPAYFPVDSKDYMEPAKVASMKAIALNPNNAEGYSALGCIAAFYEWNWKDADYYFKKSYELNPNDTEILNFIGDYYTFIAHPQAIEFETKAMELDPLHSVKHADVARAYFARHFWQQGMEFGKRFNRLEPVILVSFEDFVYAHIAMGHFDEAKRLVDAYPKSGLEEEAMLDYLRAILAVRQGQIEKAKGFLPALMKAGETAALAPGKLARMYVVLNMKKDAEKWCNKAMQQKDYYFLYDFYLLNAEESLRMEALLKSLGRPELDELIEVRRKNMDMEAII